ncbi:molybdopterin cofactor-binding domain-containing protein [Bosea sp. NPDC055332]
MTRAASPLPSPSTRLGDWFDLSTPGQIRLRTGKVELGQRILTALLQIAAEELDLDLAKMGALSGDTDLSPFEAGTVGSMSIETSGPLVRAAAAELRKRLVEAASMRAQSPDVVLQDGAFLLGGAPLPDTIWSVLADVDLNARIDGSAPVKPRDRYTVVGTSVPALGSREKLAGAAFIHDIQLPGMLHGRVLRKPHPSARLEHFDAELIRRRPGVVAVVVERDFVGVLASSEHHLDKAMEKAAGAATWTLPESVPPEAQLDILRGLACVETLVRNDLPSETGETPELIEATFTKPLIGHGSIGPSCGLAIVHDDRAELWSHSQTVFALRDQAARVLGRDVEQVRVRHVPGAGCYGHNGADDAAMDALLLARSVPGRPVRVQWSRQDELRCEPFGSPMSVRVAASVSDGRIVRWEFETRSGTHIQRPGWNGGINLLGPAAISPDWQPTEQRDLPVHNGGTKNAVALYDFSQRVAHQFVPGLPFRLSALRSLGAFANVFAVESMMDRLAAVSGIDPIAFRLAHLSDPRGRAVIERAATISAWNEPVPDGYGRGIGFARFKNTGSYCAVVALIEVEEHIVLRGLWSVVDAGLAINPAGIVAQIEGGIIQAASWALKEAVPTEGGTPTAESWRDYPILGFADIPDIEVEIISDPRNEPTGVGEIALGPTAGAIGNAVAAALGARIFDLPMTRDRVIATLMG